MGTSTLRAPDDDGLIALIRAGNPQAFEVLVGRYGSRLTAYASDLLGASGHETEEVVQDAFLRARTALLLDPSRDVALKPWLYAITRNACLDRLRRPWRTIPLAAVEQALAATGSDPAERFAHDERLRAVVRSLRRLPARQRSALVKRELEGRTHEQIAAELGVSIAASKALVFRARATMIALRPAA